MKTIFSYLTFYVVAKKSLLNVGINPCDLGFSSKNFIVLIGL